MTLTTPLVSIIVTSYNYAQWIGEALDSVAAQTYRPLECIVVDDCSTDNSRSVIEERFQVLRRETEGIRYTLVSTPKNAGQLAAFQVGLQHASGIFVNFLDADDFLFPDFIATHIQVHMMHNVAFTFCDPVEIDRAGAVLGFRAVTNDLYPLLGMAEKAMSPEPFAEWKKRLEHFRIPPASDFEPRLLPYTDLTRWYWHVTSTAVLRRAAIGALADFNEGEVWRICADRLLFTYAHWRGGSCFIPQRLAAYRLHGNNFFVEKEICGNIRYMKQRSMALNCELASYLPCALAELFAAEYKRRGETGDPIGFLRAVIYAAGPRFLWSQRKNCSRWFQRPAGLWMGGLWLKTVIRHRQYLKRGKPGNHA